LDVMTINVFLKETLRPCSSQKKYWFHFNNITGILPSFSSLRSHKRFSNAHQTVSVGSGISQNEQLDS
jgi:hypothetical protein